MFRVLLMVPSVLKKKSTDTHYLKLLDFMYRGYIYVLKTMFLGKSKHYSPGDKEL